MLVLINVMEDLVLQTVEDVLSAQENNNICNCERCKLDIAALALNNLPPQYVVTYQGEVMKRSASLIAQCKADIVKEVTKAIQVVSAHTHHDR